MKILVASPIHPRALERLREQHDVVCAFNAGEDVLRSLIPDRQVLIFRSGVRITADVLEVATDLQLVIRGGSGTDNVHLPTIEQRGIRFERIPSPGAKAVAEMAFALMLAVARNVVEADRQLRQGRWAKHELTGYQLRGKVLGVIGAGNIGTQVGQLGAAWGMDVIGCVERTLEEEASRLRAHGIRMVDLDEVLTRSDFVSVHVPLTAATRGMIGTEQLGRMKPGAYLINLARGGIVDERALFEALESKKIAGAGIDVHEHEGDAFQSPFVNMSNVVLTPHIGAGTFDSQREIGEIIVDTVAAFAGELTGKR